jgi:hypothetical protein
MSRRSSTGVKPEDEITEIVKADIARVDGVAGPANGTPVLLMKALDGEPPVDVEAVLKALHEPFTGSHSHPHPAMGDQGDDGTHEHEHSHDGDASHDHPHPVAKAEMVDCPTCDGKGKIMGGQRDCPDCEDSVKKAALSSAELNDLPDSAFAHIEAGGAKDAEGKTTPRSKRHFAIHDKAHADNAAARIAQGAEFGAEAKPKVEAAQRKFGTKAVQKAEGDELAPGSPAWEAQDAAALRTAASQLADLRSRVSTARDREAQEDDPYDWDNASDLDCAVQAIEGALGIVARLAFTEQIEAMKPAEMAKAGRRLSGKSLTAIKAARDHLTALLGPDGEEPPHEEENDVMNKALIAEVIQEQMPALATELAKALQAGTPHVPTSMPTPAGADMASAAGDISAAERQQGERLPGQNPVPETASTPEMGAEPAGGLPSGVPTPTGAQAAPAGADMSRAKGAETASDANPPLVKSADPIDMEAMAKSLLEPFMKSVAELVQPLAEGLEKVTKQVETIANQPMPGGPLLKGAPGTAPFDWLNARRESGSPALPEGTDADKMLKALEGVEDPVVRREITTRLAVSMHPVYRTQ